MIDQSFINDINSMLHDFLQRNAFKHLSQVELQNLGVGLTQQEYAQRNMTAIFWSNGRVILEIYSDPLGGEINCRIATIETDKLQHETWKYFYELHPLSTQELLEIQKKPRAPDIQLATLVKKLEVINF